jgi:hypothetical protein
MPRELTPWERFVDATRRIVAVPKKDVDKAMRDWREQRRRTREAKEPSSSSRPHLSSEDLSDHNRGV